MQPVSQFNNAYNATCQILSTVSNKIIGVAKYIFSLFYKPAHKENQTNRIIKELKKNAAEHTKKIKHLTVLLALSENDAKQSRAENTNRTQEKKLQALQRRTNKQEGNIVNLEDRLTTRKKEVEQLRKKIQAFLEDKARHQMALKTATKGLSSLSEENKNFVETTQYNFLQALKVVETKVKKLQGRSVLHKETASLGTQTAPLEDESQRSPPNRGDDQITITRLQGEIRQLKQTGDFLNTNLKTTQTEIEELASRFIIERGKVRKLQLALDAARAKAKTRTDDINALESKLITSKEENAQAQLSLTEKAEQTKNLKALLQEAGERGVQLYEEFLLAKATATNAKERLSNEKKSGRRNSAPPPSPQKSKK
jgi:chromosome segregation ATPase